jgi:hypothetical protein
MSIQRRDFLGAGAAAVAAAGLGPARADTFPSKQIRWVIPFAPAGNYDVTSRLVAEPMGRLLGQNVLIDNRPGAGGVVGLEAAVNAPADGYTIVMASFTVAYVAPIFAGKQPMLPMLAPVSILTTAPTLVVTRADSRLPDMRTLLAEATAKPGTVTMGHPGGGTTNHVAILRLQLNEKVGFTPSLIKERARASTTCWHGSIVALPISSPARCRTSSPANSDLLNFSVNRIPICPTCRQRRRPTPPFEEVRPGSVCEDRDAVPWSIA